MVIKQSRVQLSESRSLLERSCVRFPASLLNQIKKLLCYDQFGEGLKYIHTQPTNSLIKKSSIYFNVFLIRYELRIKNRIQTDIWDKLSFKIHIIRLFSWFYFVKERRCYTYKPPRISYWHNHDIVEMHNHVFASWVCSEEWQLLCAETSTAYVNIKKC